MLKCLLNTKAFTRFICAFVLIVGCSGISNEYSAKVKDRLLIQHDGRVVVDVNRRLMWAAHDNGKDISFKQAGAYLKLFRLAGYDTWRFPTVQELETIHTKGQVNSTPPGAGCAGKYEIHPFFKLTCCCPWALEEKGRRPASYPFVAGMATETMWHHHTKYSGNRILPVRDLEDGWKPN